MNTTTNTSIDFSQLRDRIGGPVVAAGEEGYDAARQAWIANADQQPAAVAFPRSAEDVAAAVRFAAANGLKVAMQGSGHGATPLDSAGTLLVKTVHLNGLEIDAGERRARAEAGVLWGDVTVAAGEAGLVALHGSSPDVGVLGYTLGGGIGWLARKHGLAGNSVLAFEVVTADGELVRADTENEPDLFWALRGGGGAFAAVTAIEFRLYPLTEAYAGWLVFDASHASAALHAWREWTLNAPDEVTTSFRLLHLPPLPDVPEPLRDRPIAAIDGAFLGSEADGEALLRPLRESAPLVMDTFATIPAPELGRLHGDPEQPLPVVGNGFVVRELTPEAADALIAAAGPESVSPLVAAELRQLGGALGREAEGAGALASIGGDFALYAFGMPMADGMAEGIGAAIGRIEEALAPWAGGRYLNFAETTGDEFAAAASGRLREVKARYDATDLFRSNHPVKPAA